MIVFPNAKINLGLHIESKRPDGYHNIETVFYPIPVNDVLEITPSNALSFKSDGIGIPSDGKSNLVQRAWELLKAEFDIPPVDFHLYKNIPIGAGLGGGSADAAFCLTALNELFELNISQEELVKKASVLGADCAFFVQNKPVFAQGTGDQFSEISVDLSGWHMVLVYPNIHVSTPAAYKMVVPKKPLNDLRNVLSQSVETWKGFLVNDFESSVFPQFPKIEKVKESLYNSGAVYASLSGSGSSVFGLFKNPVEFTFPDSKVWRFQL